MELEDNLIFDETLPSLLLKEDVRAMIDNLVEAGEAGLSAIRGLVNN